SAMAIPWEAKHLPAILQAWYPGEQGGRAVAQVLFGEIDPAGRLPVTFYDSTGDLPPFDDYSMNNRTYRYFKGTPLFAFGHGLSYTKFDYADAKAEGGAVNPTGTIKISFVVKNTGSREGDEVAQVYFRHAHSAAPQPNEALCAFTRVHLAPGASRTVNLEIRAERLRHWDAAKKQYFVEPGDYELLIGGASDDIRAKVNVKIGE
ncbi:MAG TPA: glycoside hydrolase family 3 C-terminal domain-containing protein, partial [Tepidisphaeraceae bacterium]|nr:glycoside hydrolase family 3 C-terminal domain-containing protein [Tepidisphaeraceae bacterium]